MALAYWKGHIISKSHCKKYINCLF